MTKVSPPFHTALTREEDGFLAKEYRLCWCQAHPGTPIPVCDQPEHFLADIGAATGRDKWWEDVGSQAQQQRVG